MKLDYVKTLVIFANLYIECCNQCCSTVIMCFKSLCATY